MPRYFCICAMTVRHWGWTPIPSPPSAPKSVITSYSIHYTKLYDLGLFVGFAAGLLGIGGGGIMVPVFSMLFAMQGFTSEGIMHLSLGTSMATIIFTSFASMRAHYKKRNIQTDMAMRIAVGVLAGTFAATFLASYLQGVYLALFFAAFMIWVAVTMFRKNDYLV